MNKKELWDYYCKRNPAFLRDNPKFAEGELKRFFNSLYNYVLRDGIKIGEERERKKFRSLPDPPDISDLPEGFEDLFHKPQCFDKRHNYE